MTRNKNKSIIVATGGTGGHVFPAYSLSKYLTNSGFDVTITSDVRGLKFFDKSSPIKIKKIDTTPLKRNIIVSVIKIFIAIVKSLTFLTINRPKVIFGMGGYSSFPICFSAIILKIPFIIYENNLHIGKANKYLLPFSKKIFISFDSIEGIKEKYLYKTIKIGSILREEIFNFKKKDEIKREENLNILVLGGSQAAKTFAEKLPKIFVEFKKRGANFKVIQQCIPSQNNYLSEIYSQNDLDFGIFNFSFEIIDYYKSTNLVITRGGSSAITELVNCNIPFICVPLPSAADNHQEKNARYFEKNGYCIKLSEDQIHNKLLQLLEKIDNDKSILNRIKNIQMKHSDKDVYMKIKTEIDKIL